MRILTRDLSSPSDAERTRATKFDVFEGFDSPEGVQVGKMGDLYINRNGGTSNTFWIKESGHNTNTGWATAGAGGSGGWVDEQIFVATDGQTEFTVTEFTFDSGTQLTADVNGVDQDEGGGFDWVRNVGLNKITFNLPLTSQARVKFKKWTN